MTTLVGDPNTYFFANPHPRLRAGDRVRILEGGGRGSEGTVMSYWTTSPKYGDAYHVVLDGYTRPITYRFANLELIQE